MATRKQCLLVQDICIITQRSCQSCGSPHMAQFSSEVHSDLQVILDKVDCSARILEDCEKISD